MFRCAIIVYMAAIPNLIDIKHLKLSLLNEFVTNPTTAAYSVDYDDDFDALYVMLLDCQKETVTYYINDYLALLFEPSTKDVVGIQIESFRKSFLKQYSKLQKAWKVNENKENRINDLGDIFLIRKKQEPAIAQEVAKIAEGLIPV